MDIYEFIKYIGYIGFKPDFLYSRSLHFYDEYQGEDLLVKQKYTIITHPKYNTYDFYNGSDLIGRYKCDDLTSLKKITRKHKLKQILK